jgi:hypothetical protein
VFGHTNFIIIYQVVSSPSKIKTFNGLINSEFLANKLKYSKSSTWKNKKLIALNTSSYLTSRSKSNKSLIEKNHSITPFHIYLKDERQKFIKKHANMSMKDIKKRLSERWQKMSNRMKQNYQYRSYLAKKRLYKKQGRLIQLKKPSFIKRI